MGDAGGSGPPPAGWYGDPTGQPQLRWWDGGAWTDHLAPFDGSASPPPTPRSGGSSALLVIAIVVGVLAAGGAGVILLVGVCIALLTGVSG